MIKVEMFDTWVRRVPPFDHTPMGHQISDAMERIQWKMKERSKDKEKDESPSTQSHLVLPDHFIDSAILPTRIKRYG
eukprot:2477304-Ditylum_brightwellii.AAC.1